MATPILGVLAAPPPPPPPAVGWEPPDPEHPAMERASTAAVAVDTSLFTLKSPFCYLYGGAHHSNVSDSKPKINEKSYDFLSKFSANVPTKKGGAVPPAVKDAIELMLSVIGGVANE
jgi:hypothetical protein